MLTAPPQGAGRSFGVAALRATPGACLNGSVDRSAAAGPGQSTSTIAPSSGAKAARKWFFAFTASRRSARGSMPCSARKPGSLAAPTALVTTTRMPSTSSTTLGPTSTTEPRSIGPVFTKRPSVARSTRADTRTAGPNASP